jgi:hypothetical protein
MGLVFDKGRGQAQSVSVLLYNWQFSDNQFVLATSPLNLTTSNFIFQLNTCSYSPSVTSALTRGWVCCLELLLVLASAVILRSKSCGTHDQLLRSQIRDAPNMEGQVPVFITPRNTVAQLYPQALGSLFVASYDLQGYGRGIWPRFSHLSSLYSFGSDCIENGTDCVENTMSQSLFTGH